MIYLFFFSRCYIFFNPSITSLSSPFFLILGRMAKNKASAPALPRIRYTSCFDLTQRSRCNSRAARAKAGAGRVCFFPALWTSRGHTWLPPPRPGLSMPSLTSRRGFSIPTARRLTSILHIPSLSRALRDIAVDDFVQLPLFAASRQTVHALSSSPR